VRFFNRAQPTQTAGGRGKLRIDRTLYVIGRIDLSCSAPATHQ
jgi:hypothetical protein